MKLSYFNDFSFAGETKNGTFAVNPEKPNESLLFALFTGADRDMGLQDTNITWPGEYEFGEVAVKAFLIPGENMGAKMMVEGARIVFLPARENPLSEEELSILGTVDVLVVEVPEMTTTLKKVIEEIDPKAVVPVGKDREKLLVEMGAGNVENSKEFTFTASSLPADQTLFVKLVA